MKTNIKNQLLLSSLIVASGLMLAGRAAAQTFTTLHSFTTTNGVAGTNSDGAYPFAGLITNSSGNTLYGTASRGGSSGVGTVFAVNTDGTGFTSLHNFTYGSDGAYPYAGLILSGNTLFGTAVNGGSIGAGTVFSVNTGGTGFRILWTFERISGHQEECASDYDCTFTSGYACAECVFGPRAVYVCVIPPGNCPGETHGSYPYAGLILSGDTLYGEWRLHKTELSEA